MREVCEERDSLSENLWFIEKKSFQLVGRQGHIKKAIMTAPGHVTLCPSGFEDSYKMFNGT